MRFTKASKQDGTKVTTTVTELYNYLSTLNLQPLDLAKIMRHTQTQGSLFLIEVEGITTTFYVNRAGTTLCTKAFPPGLRRPAVGHATNYDVTGAFAVTKVLGFGPNFGAF